jgi:hypothetical protein
MYLSCLFSLHVAISAMASSELSGFTLQTKHYLKVIVVVVYAFEHFSSLKILVENRPIDKYIIHYKCGRTYFKVFMFNRFFFVIRLTCVQC